MTLLANSNSILQTSHAKTPYAATPPAPASHVKTPYAATPPRLDAVAAEIGHLSFVAFIGIIAHGTVDGRELATTDGKELATIQFTSTTTG